jgi:mannose-6-phosphate isomerase-like protein (cupin superfamily)
MEHSMENAPAAPRSIALPANEVNYQAILSGKPDSAGMRSGYVRLMPGEAVGLHSTDGNEELVIPLAGTGEMRSPGTAALPIQTGRVFYNPPHTPHDVVNTGSEPLCYIYVVAKAD